MSVRPTPIEAMAPIDQLLFRGERDSARRPTTLAVYVLDRSPDWHDFQRVYERVSREFVRLRQRVVEPTGGVGPAHWVTDPDFDLTYHVRRAQLPNGAMDDEVTSKSSAGLSPLLDFLEPELMSPLDTTRPLWEVILIEGLPNGAAAIASKASHALSDGLGGMKLNELIFEEDRDAEARPMPPKPLVEDITPDELAVDNLRRISRSFVQNWQRRGADWLGKGLRTLSTPSEITDYFDSLRRTVDTSATPSPLLAGRGVARRAMVLEVPLAELKEVGRQLGGSLNDVYLAGLSDGIARYHEKMNRPIETLPMAIPISTRKPEDEVGGNHFAGMTLAAPIGERDNARRIASIRAAVRSGRDEPALGFTDDLASLMVALPAEVTNRLSSSIPAPDIQASNVPGPRDPIYLAGARVEKMFGLGPLPGAAAMVVMISYGETCSIAINYDPAAITDGALFEHCLQDAFGELVSSVAKAPEAEASTHITGATPA